MVLKSVWVVVILPGSMVEPHQAMSTNVSYAHHRTLLVHDNIDVIVLEWVWQGWWPFFFEIYITFLSLLALSYYSHRL